jgi:HPt (histidine-containing phosphotransfer) domain-containing protein
MDSLHQPGQNALKQALDRMWIQFLPLMLERVGILETAASAVAADQISPEQREAAHHAAHKLAGALGTFGLSEGTLLAREGESIYFSDADPLSPEAGRLAEIAARLRVLIESRK